MEVGGNVHASGRAEGGQAVCFLSGQLCGLGCEGQLRIKRQKKAEGLLGLSVHFGVFEMWRGPIARATIQMELLWSVSSFLWLGFLAAWRGKLFQADGAVLVGIESRELLVGSVRISRCGFEFLQADRSVFVGIEFVKFLLWTRTLSGCVLCLAEGGAHECQANGEGCG